MIWLLAVGVGFLLSVVGGMKWQAERHRNRCAARVARVRAAMRAQQ
jgi:hypothetical protein